MRSTGMNAPPAAALLLLCLLWTLPSLRSDLLPGSPSGANTPLLNQAATLALFALLAAATAIARHANWPRGRVLIGVVLIGVGLLAVPALLVEPAKGHVGDSTRVALFSLVPVFTVVLEPYLGATSNSPQRAGLAAALIAVAGTLLIFPVELPQTSMTAVAFCGVLAAIASVAAANCTAVKIAQTHTTLSLSSFAAIAAGSASILLAIAGVSLEHRSWPVAHIDAWAIPDLLSLALLFWLMRRMSAARMTTRFLIAPLVANLIALALLRPGIQARAWLGLLLISLGSAWLLFATESELPGKPSILGIHED